MDIRREGEDTVTKLYEASMEGSVVTFNSLIQKDPLLLSKISLTTFGETPLHISALLGHFNFTKQLLIHKPRLASELDSHNRSPLHLASAEGHSEVVQALLLENQDMCLVKDEDGRTPLHYAAMRGRVDPIKLLISARDESIFEVVTGTGETVMHLCVQYNHLEALKVLVESVDYENWEFLNLKERACGNTILHLAVMLKQIETVKYLISVPGIRSGEEKTLNQKFLRASDLVNDVHHFSISDFKRHQIQRIFMNSDVKPTQKKPLFDDDLTLESTTAVHVHHKKSSRNRAPLLMRWWKKVVKYMKYKGDWMDDKRGSIMVVATVIGTVTFETGLNPPGGVWGETTTSNGRGFFNCNETDICQAGTSVLARAQPEIYLSFVVLNSISFLASLSAILLLVSGFPIKNKICMWLMTVSMCASLSFMAFAFLMGVKLVTPSNLTAGFAPMLQMSLFFWLGLILLICLLQTIRFLVWFVKKLVRCFKPKNKKKKKKKPIKYLSLQ